MTAETAKAPLSQLLQTFMTQKRIPYLDAFRALSVFLVMLSHFGIAAPGPLGVTCFFFISGFLISHLLLTEARQSVGNRIDVKAFYIRRAFRILPVLLAYIIASVLLYKATGRATPWLEIWPSLVFLQNYNIIVNFPNDMTLPLKQLWSLSVEEHYYLIAPWLFVWAAYTKRWQQFILLLLGAIIIGYLWRFYALLGLHENWQYMSLATECRIDSILYGVLFALVLHQAYQHPSSVYAKSLQWVIHSPWLLWLSIAILAFIWQEDNRIIYFILSYPLFGFAFAVVLIKLLFTPGLGWLKLILEAWPLRALGIISYSLYLWHLLVFKLTAQWYQAPEFFPPYGSTLIATLLSIGVATLSYWLIEKPAIQWRRNHYDRTPQ